MATVKKKTAKKSAPKKSAPKKAAAKKSAPKKATKPKVEQVTAAEVTAWRAVTEVVDARIELLASDGIQTVSSANPVPASRWFAAVPMTPSSRRYHFVMQWQDQSKKFVLCHLVDGAGATRVPSAGGWSRALETGRIHVIASDLLLSRPQIATLIGGHEGSTGTAKPPYT